MAMEMAEEMMAMFLVTTTRIVQLQIVLKLRHKLYVQSNVRKKSVRIWQNKDFVRKRRRKVNVPSKKFGKNVKRLVKDVKMEMVMTEMEVMEMEMMEMETTEMEPMEMETMGME